MGSTRRRLLVAAVAVAAIAVVALEDPLGFADAARAWLAVSRPADGTATELLASVARRQARVRRLRALLALDPLLPAATVGVGLGAGLVVGGVVTFLYQRRRIRRGEWGG